MGKVDRLHNRVEPFSALFWALGIVSCLPTQHLTLPPPPPPNITPHRRRTQSMSLQYMVIVGSILNQDALPRPLFSYLCMLYIYDIN